MYSRLCVIHGLGFRVYSRLFWIIRSVVNEIVDESLYGASDIYFRIWFSVDGLSTNYMLVKLKSAVNCWLPRPYLPRFQLQMTAISRPVYVCFLSYLEKIVLNSDPALDVLSCWSCRDQESNWVAKTWFCNFCADVMVVSEVRTVMWIATHQAVNSISGLEVPQYQQLCRWRTWAASC